MREWLHNIKYTIWYMITAAAFLLLVLLGVERSCSELQTQASTEQSTLQQSLHRETIRFHVIANSDCGVDQERKLILKNEVVHYLSPRMRVCQSREEAEEIIYEEMSSIRELCRDKLAMLGCANEEVRVSYCTRSFPYKRYGNYLFPAGDYDALQVEIGKSRGKNWWCVMYPSLCFLDEGYQIVDTESGETLRRVLTPSEYEEFVLKPSPTPSPATVLSDEEATVSYRFWLVDWVQQWFD